MSLKDFFCTYICFELNFTCLSTFAPFSLSITRALELSQPCFVSVHSEETRGKTNDFWISEKDIVQLINHEDVAMRKA